MARNFAEGLAETGSTMMGFGLQMLKEGMDEKKRKAAAQALLDFDLHLQDLVAKGEITEQEAVAASEDAKNSVLIGARDAKEQAQPSTGNALSPQGIPIQQAGMTVDGLPPAAKPSPGNMLGAPVEMASTSPTPAAEKPAAPVTPTLSDVYRPYQQRASKLSTGALSPETKALYDKAIAAGADPAALLGLLTAKRGEVLQQGLNAVQLAKAEREAGQKGRELDIMQGKATAQAANQAARNKIAEFNAMTQAQRATAYDRYVTEWVSNAKENRQIQWDRNALKQMALDIASDAETRKSVTSKYGQQFVNFLQAYYTTRSRYDEAVEAGDAAKSADLARDLVQSEENISKAIRDMAGQTGPSGFSATSEGKDKKDKKTQPDTPEKLQRLLKAGSITQAEYNKRMAAINMALDQAGAPEADLDPLGLNK